MPATLQSFSRPAERPEFRAENMSVGARLAMLSFVLVAYGLTAALVVPAFYLPHGLLDVSPTFAVVVFALLVAVVWGLTIVSFALLSNNHRIGDRAAAVWAWMFVLQGPIAIPLYWRMHVWAAPRPPRERRSRTPPLS